MVTQSPPVEPIAVRVETAARLLDTSPATVTHWIRSGRLPASTKIGRSWRIAMSDIKALLAKGEDAR
jgi:excisionase family DNA binding protein